MSPTPLLELPKGAMPPRRKVSTTREPPPIQMSRLIFFVNGNKIDDPAPDPGMTLLTYLRLKLRLCGTKLGCGEGGCGACTVMVSKINRETLKVEHMSVNACLAPVVSMHGLAVTTVEGIGNAKTRLHAVQKRLADSHGSQCGFCTPGIVMSMYTLLRNNPLPTLKQMETYFQGNLCRCTGYRPILEGYQTFTEEWQKYQSMKSAGETMAGCGKFNPGKGCGKGEGCCMLQKETNGLTAEHDQEISTEFTPYDKSQEPIFPPELKISTQFDEQSLEFKGERVSWYRPVNLRQLLQLKHTHPDAKIVVGNTELGVEVKFKKCHYPVFINPSQVPDLTRITVQEDGIIVGAAVTLSKLEYCCLDLIKKMPEESTKILIQIVDMLQWFAGKQIRNVAAVGGNIMTGSPISDLNPIFMAAGCQLVLRSHDAGAREVNFDENFYTGYRKNIARPNEILVSLFVPFTMEGQEFVAYKQARRRDDDIAIVNAAFNIEFEQDSQGKNIVRDLRMAFGGMAPTTMMARQSTKHLIGQTFDEQFIAKGCRLLSEEFQLSPSAPGSMIRYRQSLVVSFFFKLCLQLKQNFGQLSAREISAVEKFEKEPLHAHQLYEVPRTGDGHANSSLRGATGQPIKHKAADYQVAGSAQYLDDIPRQEGELYLGLVLSTKAHARIVRIDASAARSVPGVVDWIDHTVFKEAASKGGNNQFGTTIINDEVVFADEIVHHYGMVIGTVVAVNQETAQRAAQKVLVEYEDLKPIVTIEEAINNNAFHKIPNTQIACGDDIDSVLSKAEHVVSGEARTGGQEQFYLETQACLAIPRGENDEMEIWSSTQNPTLTQNVVASVLGVPANRINVRVKRLGGGFGGKESRSVPLAAIAAVAANKVNRPVRIMLDRDEDMLISGQRNPFLGKYKIGFNSQGKIIGADVVLYCNAGWSLDLSFSVTERAMFQIDNSYKIPNLRVRGYCCKTNLPSNTAFRGFGGPQGSFVSESMLDQVACKLGMRPDIVREVNLYENGMKTHFNQELINCTIRQCWSECKKLSRYEEKLKSIAEWNTGSRWKKRGLGMVPIKFGISFTAKHLNRSGALVHVYEDGSVLVSHGGTEMGQGLHTKMIQVASRALNIDHSLINISETGTDKVPNTPPTAASAASDLNGMAIVDACQKIATNLEPYKRANPDGDWKSWVKSALFDRVCLSATGFYATPDLGYDFATNSGNPFNYFTYGVGVSEVEIDCLTGDHQVISTDIVMDLGESLNPAIDVGQIEGGFMQGYGLFMLEQMVHSPEGVLLSRGPGAYKIPSFNDIPGKFNVSLLRGASNPRAVYSSKAVGEPPLFLASSVYFAAKDAIRAAREETGHDPHEYVQIDAPATAERIRMACEDELTKHVAQLPPPDTYRPWGIQV